MGLRKLVGAITSFTIGHSLTLAAAMLDLIRVPQQIVEIGIAISLVMVAVEVLVVVVLVLVLLAVGVEVLVEVVVVVLVVVAGREGRRGGRRGIILSDVSQNSVHSGSEVFDQMHDCVGETQDVTSDVPMVLFFLVASIQIILLGPLRPQLSITHCSSL